MLPKQLDNIPLSHIYYAVCLVNNIAKIEERLHKHSFVWLYIFLLSTGAVPLTIYHYICVICTSAIARQVNLCLTSPTIISKWIPDINVTHTNSCYNLFMRNTIRSFT